MNSKKAITLLVLATLLVGLVPVLPVSAGISGQQVETVVNNEASGVQAGGGVYGDTFAVTGTGVTAGLEVEVYWDAVKAWDGEVGLLNATEASAAGSFELWFDVPEAVNGAHYVWVRDTSTGESLLVATTDADDIFAVDATIEMDPDEGLDGDEVTIYGYGFTDETDIVDFFFGIEDPDLSPGTPETDELGSWEATFDVPDAIYGDYDCIATDDEGIDNDAVTFTIGSAITIDVEEGPSGTVVTAEGRGFPDDGTIDEIALYTDADPSVFEKDCVETDEDDLEISGTGTFTVEFVIPSVDEGDYLVKIADGGVSSTASFEVVGMPGISTDPDYGIQGENINVEGFNFTAIDGEEVEVFFVDKDTALATSLGTAETDNDGTFEESFPIPGVASEAYYIEARQVDWGIDNSDEQAEFKVGLMIVILTPSSGPTGTYVHLTANGFTPSATFDANFTDDYRLYEGEGVEDDGSISDNFYIPTVEPGEYTISMQDLDSGIFVETTWEVTETTTVSTNPAVAPNEYNVTISGLYFAEDEGEEPDFVLWNETDDWAIDVYIGGDADLADPGFQYGDNVALDEDGNFTGWFEVPDDDTLSLGTYWMNVTLPNHDDIMYTYEFELVAKTTDIEPRKGTFLIGDTVAFSVESSFVQDESYIEVYDPDGDLYWKTDGFAEDDWVEVGTVQVFPYFSQIAGGNPMSLLDDAPLGEWTWTWFDADDDELDDGTFIVDAAAEDLIGEQIDDLNTAIDDLVSDISGVSDEVADVKSDISSAIAAANAAVDAANAATEAVNSVAATVGDAAQAAADASDAAEEAKSAANGLTTLVYGAIGASLVAALAAIVSLMQISKRIAG